jgi:hypothetical protein
MMDIYPVHEPAAISVELVEGSIDFSREAIHDLTVIVLRNSIGYAGAIIQEIHNEDFLEKQQAQGAKILIEHEGRIRQLVRHPSRAN